MTVLEQSILLTVALLVLVGVLRLTMQRLPSVLGNIRFLRETLEFGLWVLLSRAFVLTLDLLTRQSLDVPWGWPTYAIEMSFHLDGPLPIVYSLLSVAGFLLVVRNYTRIINTRLSLFLLIGFLLVVWNVSTMNALQGGLVEGFSNPISGGQAQYYHDAIEFDSASQLVGEYNQIQESLQVHSRAHPFGPDLLLYFLNNLVDGSVFWISVIIALLSCASIFPTYLLFKELGVSERPRRALLLISTFLPSVVIYYGTSLDAIIALAFTAAVALSVYSFRHNNHLVALAGGLVVSVALLLTFVGVFIVGALAMWLFVSNITTAGKRWFSNCGNLAIVVLVPLVVLLLVRQFLGFDYLASYLLASQIENPEGFRLLSEPLNYLVTRAENIWDILLFIGPVCSVLLYRTIKRNPLEPRHNLFAMVGMSMLLLIFLSGAYQTGETARACLFIVPYLLLPIATHLDDSDRDGRAIVIWLFVQTLAMQTFFSFFW